MTEKRVNEKRAKEAARSVYIVNSEQVLAVLATLREDAETVEQIVKTVKHDKRLPDHFAESLSRLAGMYLLLTVYAQMNRVIRHIRRESPKNVTEDEQNSASRALETLLPQLCEGYHDEIAEKLGDKIISPAGNA